MATEQIRQIARRIHRDRIDGETPEHWRPTKRSECIDGPRPCPYVGCRYNLLVEPTRAGSIKMPHGRPWEVADTTESCSLDIADRGSHSLDDVADKLGMCREVVAQGLRSGMAKIKALGVLDEK